MAFLTQSLNLDTNSEGEVTESINITNQSCLSWTIDDLSGSYDNRVVIMQESLNNVLWVDTDEMSGIHKISENLIVPCGYIRFKTLVPEGSESITTIIVNAK